MTGYYGEKLAGERLRHCYDLASPRVQQYLEAEIAHVMKRLGPTDAVLELGCGYGRVALRLAQAACRVVGIDTAQESLDLARWIDRGQSCEFMHMDALDLGRACQDSAFQFEVLYAEFFYYGPRLPHD